LEDDWSNLLKLCAKFNMDIQFEDGVPKTISPNKPLGKKTVTFKGEYWNYRRWDVIERCIDILKKQNGVSGLVLSTDITQDGEDANITTRCDNSGVVTMSLEHYNGFIRLFIELP